MFDAEATARAVPGFVEPLRYPDGGGDGDIRDRYRRLHKRAPKLSDAVDARPEGLLGYLYAFDGHDGIMAWKAIPITKITKNRIFVKADRYSGQEQNSYDREALERDGSSYYWVEGQHTYAHGLFTEAGRKAYEDRRARWDAHWAEQRSKGLYPVLELKQGFTRDDVMSAFRRLAHDLHPARAATRSSSASWSRRRTARSKMRASQRDGRDPICRTVRW